MNEIPDTIEEVVGWRAWGVKLVETRRPVLYSVVHEAPWPTDRWMVAECADGRRRSHQPPDEYCACGIYAARNRAQLDHLGYADDDCYLKVIGEVGLAGRVVVGEMGWRAERARVRRLFVPYEHWQLVAALHRAYGVPVELGYTLGPEEVPA